MSSASQKKIRIKHAICSIAYERFNVSLISDVEYDNLSIQIDVAADTDRPDLDDWYRAHHVDYTGNYYNTHPEYDRLVVLVSGIVRANLS